MHWLTPALFIALLLFISNVDGVLYAYLDPGTGSIVLQLVLGGVVAALATARLYWTRIRSLALRRRQDQVDPARS
jgi:hypothetical protein